MIVANAIINIMLQPAVKSASDPNDGVCEDGEGWGCIAEIASETFVTTLSLIDGDLDESFLSHCDGLHCRDWTGPQRRAEVC